MIQLRTLLRQVETGRHFGENWYQRAKTGCDAVGDILGVDPEYFAYCLAVFSPRVPVIRSVRLATQFCLNPDIKPAGCLSAVYETALKYQEDCRLNGPKTENFRQSIVTAGFSDSLCLDVWSCRGLNVEQKKAYNVGQFRLIRRLFERANRETGLYLPQLQACQWYAVMSSWGRNIAGFDLLPQSSITWIQNYYERNNREKAPN